MKDKRSTDAIDAAMRYANGEITREELNKYIAAAYDAAYDAAAYAYTYAYAADAAADVASADSDAAASDAAYASAYAYAANAANYQATADICREVLTEEVFEKLKNYEQPN
jgi:hypothetical protein